MDDWIDIRKDDAHVARERARARELRKSAWWKAQVRRGVCRYCGREVPPGELTMDHVVPVSRGGRSTRGNVVPCCPACNKAKSARTPAETLLDSLFEPGPADDSNGS
ncbi:MAG: HNH endonuclease [Kiritimatiellia bacterium]|jgi:5-methylcytosine-specific restriction protein A